MSMDPIHIAERITCEDGWSISIQAGWSHYCQPRENFDRAYGYWSKYELGYPSEFEESLLYYAEDPEAPLQTVYAYVPRELVLELIEKHGGPTVGEKTDKCPQPVFDHKKTILKSLGFEFAELMEKETAVAK